MAKIETVTYTLPVFWACPLINGDESELTDEESSEIAAWLQAAGQVSCVGVSDSADFVKWHDARNFHDYAGDCLEFTFQVIKG